MDPIKEAFLKMKYEIFSLKEDLNLLKEESSKTKEIIFEMYSILEKLHKDKISTDQPSIKTDSSINPINNTYFKPLNAQNLGISIRNKGVSTDRQTNRQTDNSPSKELLVNENSFETAAKILDSLDTIKKELRLKFKRLTDQEMLVFSAIYQLEEEKGFSDYKSISIKLNLTESSIRDYIGRLIKKGIPLEKRRLNNKNIQLFISPDLKKIVSLSTIMQLRNL